jgi:hypothetical protein
MAPSVLLARYAGAARLGETWPAEPIYFVLKSPVVADLIEIAGGEECQLICGDSSIEVECGSNGGAELRLLLIEQYANPVSQSLNGDRGDVVAADN